MPKVLNAALVIGSRPAAASGLGTARDQAACDEIPAASAHLPVLQRNDLRGTAVGCADRPVGTAARGVLRAVDGVVDQDNIQSTNNTAERALRYAVIWRKLCFGTQSAKGSRFVERALTVIETCRLQKRNVFAYVTEAVEAHMAGRKSPSLLPAP